MSLAIWEMFMGLNELILKGDKRRLWQSCHYTKRGFLFIISFGKIRIPKINYYEGFELNLPVNAK